MKNAVFFGIATAVALSCAAENRVWIEDLDRSSMTCSYRTPLVARSIEGGLLMLGGKTYEKGLGTHANSSLAVPLGGNALRFEADVGIDDEMKDRRQASIEFNVWGDGRLLATSGILKKKKRIHHFNVDLTDVRVAVLEVTDAGDGNDSDHADWCHAFFAFKDGTGPAKPSELTDQLGVLTPPIAAEVSRPIAAGDNDDAPCLHCEERRAGR